MPALPPFKITAGGLDLTYEAENLSFSNIDPGGCEIASFELQSDKASLLDPGSKVLIMDGLQTIWVGRVAEPARSIKHGLGSRRKVGEQTTRVSCEGAGAAFKDNLMSMVYIDRDLSHWQDWSVSRQATWTSFGGGTGRATDIFSWRVGADTVSLVPGLVIQGQAVFSVIPIIEIWYDAGPNNTVARIRINSGAAMGYPFPDANNSLLVFTAADDGAGSNHPSANFASSFPSVDFTTPVPQRYAAIQHFYNTAPAGTAGQTYGYSLRNISVIGNHGLVLRGAAPSDGFYASDIAAHAAFLGNSSGAGIKIGQVDALTNYILQHYVQYTRIPHDQVLQDMAQIAPAHYGTWQNSSLFEETPEWTFRAYGNEATHFAGMSDVNEADLTERLASLYTTAVITWQDGAGIAGETVVTLPNSVLDRQGISRTVTFDLGTSNSAAATTFASFVLQLLYAQAITAGSVDLPRRIRDGQGASVPSYQLKAGIHRLRLNDIPTRKGLLQASDRDSFRISRVESSVDSTSGEVSTRVELDIGPNLIETLQARLNEPAGLFGL